MAALMSGMDDPEREALVQTLAGKLGALLHSYNVDGELVFRQEAHVLLARKVAANAAHALLRWATSRPCPGD
jgi:hypothetical protein